MRKKHLIPYDTYLIPDVILSLFLQGEDSPVK